MRGAIPPFPQYPFMASTGTPSPLLLPYISYHFKKKGSKKDEINNKQEEEIERVKTVLQCCRFGTEEERPQAERKAIKLK
jgi:hypothetical protein